MKTITFTFNNTGLGIILKCYQKVQLQPRFKKKKTLLTNSVKELKTIVRTIFADKYKAHKLKNMIYNLNVHVVSAFNSKYIY